jgi:hypothetical protein
VLQVQRNRQQGIDDVVKTSLALLCCVVLAACAADFRPPAAQAPESTGAAAPATDSSPLPGSPHDQINQLEEQITIDRTKLELAEPAAADVAGTQAQPMGALPAIEDPKCKPAQNDTCKASCTLSDSICGNANKICEIAKSLVGDDWARNKCAKANTTCEQSHTKCCGCQ